MKFRVFIEQDEDGVFVAHCPSLPGWFSQAKTRIEAQANIRRQLKTDFRRHYDSTAEA